jgi:hypothetical protein
VKDLDTGRMLTPREVEQLNLADPGSQWSVQESSGPIIRVTRKQ